jgi:hypothetical protein
VLGFRFLVLGHCAAFVVEPITSGSNRVPVPCEPCFDSAIRLQVVQGVLIFSSCDGSLADFSGADEVPVGHHGVAVRDVTSGSVASHAGCCSSCAQGDP